MKKNVLALSIAAMIGGLGFAGAASAVVLNGGVGGMTASNATVMEETSSGVGHNLYVPYFNVQDGNMTVLHVVNTDQVNGKAVKVRFRGAANSDDLFDFQVFMSPGDVWTAAISAGADGIAQIVTADNTCTVPALTSGVNQSFFTNRLNPAATDSGKAAQTREGYVEIFNMADIPVNAAPTSLYTAIKHVANVAPCSVAGSAARTRLNTIATTDFGDAGAGVPAAPAAAEAAAFAAGFNTPTSGLMGDWYIINVPNTTTFSGGATAVVAKVAAGGVAGRANFVHFPQSDTPVVGGINNFTADPLLRGPLPIVVAGNYDLPDMSTPYVSIVTDPIAQASSLTAALAVKSITNEYANDAGIAAKTDWLFSMPTRRYSVAANYAVLRTAPNYRVFTALTSPWFVPANTSVDADGKICVKAESQTFFNREETTPGATTPGPVFSPSTPGVTPVVQFCGETSVLSFADAGNSVMAATVARQNLVSGTYTNGWGTIATDNGGVGLPIVGSAFIKLTNGAARTGTSGTYGINWPHRFTK